jgi:polyphosphate glucokinase
MATEHAIGIDIGGTGIKGAIVDLATGELASERTKVRTPEGGRPADLLDATRELLDQLDQRGGAKLPLGVCFPAVVKHGRTLSAANISDEWIGLPAEGLFEQELGREIHFINDADAAGYAESRYGAAVGAEGLVILTTLGTGIGSAAGRRSRRRDACGVLRDGTREPRLGRVGATVAALLLDGGVPLLPRPVRGGGRRVEAP